MESVLFTSGCVKRSRRQQQRRALHCSGVAYLVFVDLYFIFCIMRGVLREKVKKKTKATQSIAKVLMANNMSSKSHKFNF